jgi:hypothetical protein
VTTFVPLLTKDQIDALPPRAREVVEYRKSGLSLNHVQGCPGRTPSVAARGVHCGPSPTPAAGGWPWSD